jgi:hypothetical protein
VSIRPICSSGNSVYRNEAVTTPTRGIQTSDRSPTISDSLLRQLDQSPIRPESAGTISDSEIDSEFVELELPLATLPNVCQSPRDVFELARLARASRQVSPRYLAILTILLESAAPGPFGGRSLLWPLWANEAMQRAYNFLDLTIRLSACAPEDCDNHVAMALDAGNVAALAKSFRALDIVNEEEFLPCSKVLGINARGLIELFGPTVGSVLLSTKLERLALPAFKRRALVLLCSELLVNALRHAFESQTEGLITVTLSSVDGHHGRLVVADNGRGVAKVSTRPGSGIAFDLALLLEGDIRYRELVGSGTMVEVTFSTYL